MMQAIQQINDASSAVVATNELNAVLPEGTPPLLTTAELARLERTAEQTIRKNHCKKGHHHGMVPIKLPNGHLRWLSARYVSMLNGGAK